MTGARSVGKWVLGLAALGVATALWALVAQRLTHPVPVTLPPGRVQPRAIVWDNRVFSSRASLASWLASRGATYQRWARLHRGDAAIVEHVSAGAYAPPAHDAASTSRRAASPPAGSSGPSGKSATNRAPASRTASGSSFSLAWASSVLLVLGALVMLAAVIPAALVQLPGGDRFSATGRTYVFAFGFSISVGVLIAGIHA